MNKSTFIRKYLKYFFTADTKYNVHSPFVYDLVSNVIDDHKRYPEYRQIRRINRELKNDSRYVRIQHIGAGSNESEGNEEQKKLGEIAGRSGHLIKYQKLLFRLVRYFQPKTILELGTSLGSSSMVFSIANPDAGIETIEGNPVIAEIAGENFRKFSASNILLYTGTFEEVLPTIIDQTPTFDLVFFDGNHRKKPTLNYFNICLEKANNNSVFIFDDINWSDEMQEAWQEIKEHPDVRVTIDLYTMGLVFFRNELSRQDFVIRF